MPLYPGLAAAETGRVAGGHHRACCSASLAAVVADRFDDSVQTPDEVRHRLHLPILGSIPRVRDTLFGRSERQRFRLISHVEPQSLIAEAFRSLRTNIAFARAHHDLRTIVLTSPGPGDGKSTVACNLATIFAQQGQRTLLVDADLRRAVVNETFECRARLASAICSSAMPDWREVVRSGRRAEPLPAAQRPVPAKSVRAAWIASHA